MSCYIIDKKDINLIVSYFSMPPRSAYWFRMFEVNSENDLGQALTDLNQLSVNNRYNENDTPEKFTYKIDMSIKIIKVVVALESLVYQCHEAGDTNHNKLINNMLASVSRDFIHSSDQYKFFMSI